MPFEPARPGTKPTQNEKGKAVEKISQVKVVLSARIFI